MDGEAEQCKIYIIKMNKNNIFFRNLTNSKWANVTKLHAITARVFVVALQHKHASLIAIRHSHPLEFSSLIFKSCLQDLDSSRQPLLVHLSIMRMCINDLTVFTNNHHKRMFYYHC